jgi:hypothetical protein
MKQFNKPALNTQREAPHYLHFACSYGLLLNPDITRRKWGLCLALRRLATCFKELASALRHLAIALWH